MLNLVAGWVTNSTGAGNEVIALQSAQGLRYLADVERLGALGERDELLLQGARGLRFFGK